MINLLQHAIVFSKVCFLKCVLLFTLFFVSLTPSFSNQIKFQKDGDAGDNEYTDEKLLPAAKTANTFFQNPFLEIQAGQSDFSYKVDNIENFRNLFTTTNSYSIKIGSRLISPTKIDGVLTYSSAHIGLSYLTAQKNNVTLDAINLNSWYLSGGSKDGYAYTLGKDAYLALYNGDQLNLNWLDLDDFYKNASTPNLADEEAMRNFGESTRFGTSFQAGIEVQLVKNISFSAEYEKSMIFPRVLLFKHSISSLIEQIPLSIVDMFIHSLSTSSSSSVVPIVNFVLKNAVSYGYYSLASKNMNWPFDTAQPLVNDNFKIGLSYNF